MGPTVDVPDAFTGQMRVQLRRGDTRMPEQLLDDAQVGATFQQMGRERVTQGVRTDPVRETGSGCRALDGGPRLLASKATSAIADEDGATAQRAAVFECHQSFPWTRHPAGEFIQRQITHRHQSFLVALADDPDERTIDGQILAIEPDRLADQQPGRVE